MPPESPSVFLDGFQIAGCFRTVNARAVRLGNIVVGTLYGVDATPGNPQRPTAFLFYPLQDPRQALRYDRLETAREGIEREMARR